MSCSPVSINAPLSGKDMELKAVDIDMHQKLRHILTTTSPELVTKTMFGTFPTTDIERFLKTLSAAVTTTTYVVSPSYTTRDNRWSNLTGVVLSSIFEYVDDKTRLTVVEVICKNWRQQCIKSGWTSLNMESIPHEQTTMWCHTMGIQRLKTVRDLQLSAIPRDALSKIIRHTPSVQRARMTLISNYATSASAPTLTQTLGCWSRWTHLLSLDITIRRFPGDNITFPTTLPMLDTFRLKIDMCGDDDDNNDGDENVVQVLLPVFPMLHTLEVTSFHSEIVVNVGEKWDPHRTIRHVSIINHRTTVSNTDFHNASHTDIHRLLVRSSKYLLSLTTEIVNIYDVELVSKLTNLQWLRLDKCYPTVDSMFWSNLSSLSKLTYLDMPWTWTNRNSTNNSRRTHTNNSRRTHNLPINLDLMTSMCHLETIVVESAFIDDLRIVLSIIDRFPHIRNIRIAHNDAPLLSVDEFRQYMKINPIDNPSPYDRPMRGYLHTCITGEKREWS